MKLSVLNTKDLRSKKATELEEYIEQSDKSLNELRQAIVTNKEKQTHQISNIKKSIARAKTILAQQLKEEKGK